MHPTSSAARRSGRATLFLAAALALSAGCYHVHVVVPNTPPTDYHRQWVNGFLWGAVGGGVDTSRFCGGRPVSRVSTHRSFGNLFMTWLTFGIYTPSTVVVACGQGGGFGGPAPYQPPYYPQPQPQPQPYYPPAQPQPQPQPYYPPSQPQPPSQPYYQPAPP
jgi:hypothetical protein